MNKRAEVTENQSSSDFRKGCQRSFEYLRITDCAIYPTSKRDRGLAGQGHPEKTRVFSELSICSSEDVTVSHPNGSASGDSYAGLHLSFLHCSPTKGWEATAGSSQATGLWGGKWADSWWRCDRGYRVMTGDGPPPLLTWALPHLWGGLFSPQNHTRLFLFSFQDSS